METLHVAMETLHVCSVRCSREVLSVCVSYVFLLSAFNETVNGRLMHDGGNNGSRAQPEDMILPQRLSNSTSYYNHGSLTFNVLLYGAKGDGMTDDTQAFQSAWQAACQFESAVLEIPARYSFIIQSTIFSGPCESSLTFQVDGVLLAPDGPACWATNSSRLQWIVFYRADGLILQGNGLIDGNGENWWNLPCKPHKGVNGSTLPGPCESPVAIRFFKSSNVTLRNLRIRNSPQFHVKFDSCESVHIDNIIISSPALSPNTDGIHISDTRSVGIYNSDISNGDDCISIGSGCSDVDIKNVTCGPSHGISIGGLGNHNSQACVSNITVSDVLIKNSDNGVRIKTWQGGLGWVSGVTFNNVYVDNVRNPIIIDQFYCFTKGCKNQTAAVYVSDIAYRHIRGTYDARSPAIHFACSDTVPCTNITLRDVMLLPAEGQIVADPYCWNAYGTLQSLTIPPVTCLIDADPHPSIEYNIDSCL